MAPHISSAKPSKSQPEVPSGTSVDEPGGENSKEYRLSHRVCHLLPESNPLKSTLASGKRCLHQQLHNEPLQEYLSCRGTYNFPSSSNCMKLPYGSHAYLSKCKCGTSTPGKSRTRQAPVSPEVPTPPHTGNILYMGEIPKAGQRLPTSRAKHTQFAYMGEENP